MMPILSFRRVEGINTSSRFVVICAESGLGDSDKCTQRRENELKEV